MPCPMKHLLTILLFVCCLAGFSLQAAPVSKQEAQRVAATYLKLAVGAKADYSVAPVTTLQGANGTDAIYVFDIDNGEGFILVCADDKGDPILGYSFKGPFVEEQLPPNMKGWLRMYQDGIELMAASKAPADPEAAQEWAALRSADAQFYQRDTKEVDELLETEWHQGEGFNNYCPEYSNGPGGHSYVGCVATAMAQIMRYYKYPSCGFGSNSYGHYAYGAISARFDTAYYDFSKMPAHVTGSSSQAIQHACSQFCYHCGVSVNMTYQYQYHNSGSGAYSQDVPGALEHFGYFDTRYEARSYDSTEVWWRKKLQAELDGGHPVYYSATSSDGGHAFVCDGYRSTKFHFNWGWGGSSNGFYTLSTMCGFAAGQAAVFNIRPSGIASGYDTLYVAVDGTGDGSSWAKANPHLECAMQARKFYKSGQVWVKAGTYYGDTVNNGSAFFLPTGVSVYGGFAGGETRTAQRNAAKNPTIINGNGRGSLFASNNYDKNTYLYSLTFTNVDCSNSAILRMEHFMTVRDCIFRGNRADSNSVYSLLELLGGTVRGCTFENNNCDILFVNSGSVRDCIIWNNHTTNGLYAHGGTLKNCIIAHNSGNGVWATNGTFVNCDITRNGGLGIGLAEPVVKMRNCLIWGNAEAFIDTVGADIAFCAIDNLPASLADGQGNIDLNSTNTPAWRAT